MSRQHARDDGVNWEAIGQCPEPTNELRGVAALGYVAHHEHMDGMEKQGQRSLLCAICMRYRYAAERCSVFEAAAGATPPAGTP